MIQNIFRFPLQKLLMTIHSKKIKLLLFCTGNAATGLRSSFRLVSGEIIRCLLMPIKSLATLMYPFYVDD
jgi:hypothetical protein